MTLLRSLFVVCLILLIAAVCMAATIPAEPDVGHSHPAAVAYHPVLAIAVADLAILDQYPDRYRSGLNEPIRTDSRPSVTYKTDRYLLSSDVARREQRFRVAPAIVPRK